MELGEIGPGGDHWHAVAPRSETPSHKTPDVNWGSRTNTLQEAYMLTLKWAKAAVECEGCGKTFEVFLDPGDLSDGMDLNDLAKEAVINGNKSTDDGPGSTSIQGDFVLCRACTKRCDAVDTPNDRNLTREEVSEVLGYPVL